MDCGLKQELLRVTSRYYQQRHQLAQIADIQPLFLSS
jgi:hypothetical protein